MILSKDIIDIIYQKTKSHIQYNPRGACWEINDIEIAIDEVVKAFLETLSIYKAMCDDKVKKELLNGDAMVPGNYKG